MIDITKSTEVFCATVVRDADGMGAVVQTWGSPKGCPGLGGWKESDVGKWTRVNGDAARDLLRVAEFAPGNQVTIYLDGDRIAGVEV